VAIKKRKSQRESCEAKIFQNRDRKVEELFSDLERQIVRERLSILAPDREKQNEHTRQIQTPHP
jgi:hypothetical protein